MRVKSSSCSQACTCRVLTRRDAYLERQDVERKLWFNVPRLAGACLIVELADGPDVSAAARLSCACCAVQSVYGNAHA